MNINEEMKLHKWAQDMTDQKSSGLSQKEWCSMKGIVNEYYSAAEPPVRCGESHLSGLTEPPLSIAI